MAVQRFRTIEGMAAAPVVVPPGDGFERFARHCARYWAIAPRVTLAASSGFGLWPRRRPRASAWRTTVRPD